MCDKLIDLMRTGKSVARCCAELGIAKDTWYSWIDPTQSDYQPDFADAVKRGMTLSEAYWCDLAERYLVAGPEDKKLNTALWFINMKNRFHWSDRVEQKIDQSANLTIAQSAPLFAVIGAPPPELEKASEELKAKLAAKTR